MHAVILKRVGCVLIIAGLLDIGVLIYCVANHISYTSSLHLFAVISGIFLLRGSLRAATVVRWLAIFALAACSALLVAWPLLQPFSLTLLELRLNPRGAAISVLYAALFLGLLFWIAKELGSAPIQNAIIQAGRKSRDMRIPAAVGVGLVIVIGVLMSMLLGGESAERAKSMAEQQLGHSYRFYVSALRVAKNYRGTFVSGEVMAWNDFEIKTIPVHWEEH